MVLLKTTLIYKSLTQVLVKQKGSVKHQENEAQIKH